MVFTYCLIDITPTPSFGFVLCLVGDSVAPLQPELVIGTVAALRVVLRSSKVLVVGTALAPAIVSSTVVGYVGTTCEILEFSLFPCLVIRSFLVNGSRLCLGGCSREFTLEFLDR